MKPTKKQLLELLQGEEPGAILSSVPPETLAAVAMEGAWTVAVRVAGWKKEGGLSFTLGADGEASGGAGEKLTRQAKLRIALALTFAGKQIEFCSKVGELSLLCQAAELPELTSAGGVCYLSIGEMFELLGEKAPRNLATWYKPIGGLEGRNVALGEGMVKVWATDGQVALATWAGGRRGGIVELANIVEEKDKAPKKELEARVTKLEKAYQEALELIHRLTNKAP